MRSLLVLLCVCPSLAWAGVISVKPTTVVDDAIGVSYRFRVEEQSGSQYGKILFVAHSLYNPSNCTGQHCPQHQVETLIGNSTHVPQVGDCCWDGVGTYPGPPTCSFFNAAPFSGLKVGAWIGEKTTPAGLWMSDAALWPRRALGVDGSLTDFKLEATYQRDITGLDGQITWRRGAVLSSDDPRTWGRGCLPALHNRPMRQWHVDVTVGGDSFYGTAIYPDDEATYIRPDRLIELVTEFFEFPGTVRIFVWDIVTMSERDGTIPLRTFTIVRRLAGVPTGYWGVRVAEYQERQVVEFGTAPGYVYTSEPGDIITYAALPPVISAITGIGVVIIIVLICVLLYRRLIVM